MTFYRQQSEEGRDMSVAPGTDASPLVWDNAQVGSKVLVDPAIRNEGGEPVTQYLQVAAADLGSIREPGLQSLPG